MWLVMCFSFDAMSFFVFFLFFVFCAYAFILAGGLAGVISAFSISSKAYLGTQPQAFTLFLNCLLPILPPRSLFALRRLDLASS